MTVAGRLEEEADALLGHFVDQGRRSGASWSQIGAGMGVSKQAAQKRFVPRWDGSDPIPVSQLFSRLTQRARNVLAMARAASSPADVTAGAVVVELLSEPDGLAAKILHELGVSDRAMTTAFGLPLAGGGAGTDAGGLRQISFADDAEQLLRGALKAVLRLGHNYVGTEHLLLGALFANGAAATTLGGSASRSKPWRGASSPRSPGSKPRTTNPHEPPMSRIGIRAQPATRRGLAQRHGH